MRLLLDEMYPAALASALLRAGIDASRAAELGLAGSSDAELIEAAALRAHSLLTENVSDFTRIAGDAASAGQHHRGLLIALSSRFTRSREGIEPLVAAVHAISGDELEDRVVFLERQE